MIKSFLVLAVLVALALIFWGVLKNRFGFDPIGSATAALSPSAPTEEVAS